MTTFLRSLQQLTSSLQICSIITNAAIGGSDSTSSHNIRRRIGVNVSIFASNFSRPALGRQFSLLIDSSVLLSNVSDLSSLETQHAKHDHMEIPSNAGMVEVLYDKTGSREGKWAAFEIVAGSEVKGLR